MTTVLDRRPMTAHDFTGPAAGDDDLVHVVCCNPDLALCGSDVTGTPLAGPGEILDEDNVCPVCLIACDNQLGCSAPGCPERERADHD
jgi:hypothetical protein